MPGEFEGTDNGSMEMEGSPVQENFSAGSESPYLEYDGDDGKKYSYKTKDEVVRAFKDSYLRQADYTKKTTTLAEDRKKWETERSEWEKNYQKQREEYSKFDSFLKNNPAVFKKIKEEMAKGETPDNAFLKAEALIAERLSPLENKLKEYENEKLRLAEEQKKAQIQKKLAEKYADDFDENALNDIIQRLPEMSEEDLYDLVYRAHLGSRKESEISERLQRKNAEKKAGNLMSPSTKGSGAMPEFKSFEEARRHLQGY